MSTTTRVTRRNGKTVHVDGYVCAECKVWGPVGEVHTYLFCELHKLGWTRSRILSNLEFTAEALGWTKP